jgi:Zn-dependent peptidase ImmA (M78 family)
MALTEEQVADVRKRFEQGQSKRALAKRFGVSRTNIRRHVEESALTEKQAVTYYCEACRAHVYITPCPACKARKYRRQCKTS